MNPNTYQSLAFLSGAAPDDQGRMVSDYLAFSPEKWEECHNHIQWAFPSSIPSEFNPGAPVIDYDTFVNAIFDTRTDTTRNVEGATVIENVVNLTITYLASVGITFDSTTDECIVDLAHPMWNTPDHNHRRLTRLILMWHYMDDVIWHTHNDMDGFYTVWNFTRNKLLKLAADRASDPYWDNVLRFWYKALHHGTI